MDDLGPNNRKLFGTSAARRKSEALRKRKSALEMAHLLSHEASKTGLAVWETTDDGSRLIRSEYPERASQATSMGHGFFNAVERMQGKQWYAVE
jgi:hypothetical protein